MTSAPAIGPVDRESTASIIADRLRGAIEDGTLPPGTQLGEADLARRFDVSRGTLREAMQRLVADGLLHGERHRGLSVRVPSGDDVVDVYLSRNAVEQAAARLVLRGDRVGAAGRLAEACAQMRIAAARDDLTGVGSADAYYHEMLVAASGSPRLARTSRTLLTETRMCLHALRDSYLLPGDRVGEHEAIAAAIREGNEALALGLIDAHMEDAVRRLAPGRGLHFPAPAP